MTSYGHGKNAALRGCYRLLACPKDDAEEREWLTGWDSVAVKDRGTLPVSVIADANCIAARRATATNTKGTDAETR